MSGLHLPERVRTLAATQPHALSIVDGERSLDAASFDALTTRLADALTRVAAPGDHIGAALETGLPGAALFVASAKAGMIFTPLNWRLPAHELAAVAVDAEVTVFVADPAHTAVADAVRTALPDATVLLAGDELDAFTASGTLCDPGFGADPDAPLLQLYTSGTTGRPKGVVITHRNLHNDADGFAVYHWRPDSVALDAMPLFHIAGAGWMSSCVSAGIPLVLLPRFDARAVAETVERHRISHMFLVPSTIQMLIEDPASREHDLSSLRVVAYGSAPITTTLLTRAIEALGCGFLQRYGMTETAGSVTALRVEDHDPSGPHAALLTSAGTPMPGVEISIRDTATGETLAAGETGEIVCRSRNNTRSYWRRPDATAELYTDDGFLRTGDAGHLDDSGYLFVTDRIKDMIISGGENVYPVEVESALAEHPAVAEVAVVGVADIVWGEAVTAVVRVRAGSVVPSEAELIAFAAERVASFKKPRRVVFVDEMPRGATGKLLKRTLREQLSDSLAGAR
ncbi:long-chain fatty acid--CoA ligase [Rhodococcus rhodnii]|uniref:Long-chain-fatty-acid--CoA ligase n=2 Tax=Rhodococcus rhodnii TaxID=38312 RepID=R7WNS9_9NOCA|nr:AMP-binding protein [Rhodococcus rhodnii]EOM76968.1 long-chain-fatty-acid--CoA ligase [Rhodococcus rhodnii LMG 5362]TXG92479.1 long-chain fatty acid--CoA ligase [Rhodococcus rhodnii]